MKQYYYTIINPLDAWLFLARPAVKNSQSAPFPCAATILVDLSK